MSTVWDLSRIRYTVRKLTGRFDTTQLPDSSGPGPISNTNPAGIDDYINDFYLYDMPEHFRTLKLRDFFEFTTIPNCGTYSVPQNIVQIYDPVYVDNYQMAWHQYPDTFYRLWPELDFIDRNLFQTNGISIINITAANPAIIFTATDNGLVTGDNIVIDGVTGTMASSINGISFSVTVISPTEFSIPLNTIGLTYTGGGVYGPTVFSFTLTQTPVQQGTVVIGLQPNKSGQIPGILETFTDQDQPIPLDIPQQQYFVNPGILTGNQGGSGTIDYLTGDVVIKYKEPPPIGQNGSIHYHPYVASRSRDMLFWQQQIFLRPIPNDTYSVKVMAYMLPTTVISAATNSTSYPSILVDPETTPTSPPTATTVTIVGFDGNTNSDSTDLPQFSEWWQLISYGAALKILAEDADWQEYDMLKMKFEEQKMLAQRKTLKQLGSQRIQTPYADNNTVAPAFPIFPLY